MVKRILVVHSHAYWPLRVSVADHLYSIGRYSRNEVHYLNAFDGRIPFYLQAVRFDAIIFHTSLLSRRWDTRTFEKFKPLAVILAQMTHVRIAMPQDEFTNTKILEDWLLDAKVDVVCSILKPAEWKKVYPRLVLHGVTFHQVLTGYLSDEFVALAGEAVTMTLKRDIDVGYRAWGASAWLGRHGHLKIEIARRAQACSHAANIVTDISTKNSDSISGFDWLLFLARCRYVLGVEGGASIHDRDGSVRTATEAFVLAHPLADFDEVEAACFPGRDGELDCRALSPRHLEACATRTAQVLVEGEYNGLLKPDLHYFAVKPDFSNLPDVLSRIGDERRRLEVATRAYDDIVRSGVVSYRTFVDFLDQLADADKFKGSIAPARSLTGMRLVILRGHMKLLDWGLICVWSVIAGIIKLGRIFGHRIDSNQIIRSARGILRFVR